LKVISTWAVFRFREGADAIITAEKNLYGGKKTKALIKIFKDRGIFS